MRENSIQLWISDRVVVPTVQSLDKRMKRIVALASLFGYLLNPKKRDKALEDRLSKTMDLAFNSSSLTLPMIYHNLLWQVVERRSSRELHAIKKKFAAEHQQAVTTEEAQNYASVLVQLMPACLQYDSIEVVRMDIIHLFESIPYILGEAQPC